MTTRLAAVDVSVDAAVTAEAVEAAANKSGKGWTLMNSQFKTFLVRQKAFGLHRM